MPGAQQAYREIHRHGRDKKPDAGQKHHSPSTRIHGPSRKRSDRDRAHGLCRHDAADLRLARSSCCRKPGRCTNRNAAKLSSALASAARMNARVNSGGSVRLSEGLDIPLIMSNSLIRMRVRSSPHSARSVEIGSMRLARIAGISIATQATIPNTVETRMKMCGSDGPTP